MPDLSVIIISYQTCALTLRSIEASLSQSGPSIEVIVVDNASGDGTAAAITRRFRQVRLIANDSNLGFARANNLAAQQARGKFLLLLNPDTIAQPGAFAEITDFARQSPDAMIWGGRVIRPDGTTSPRSCARRPALWSVIAQAAGLAALWPASSLVNPGAMPGWNRDEIRQIDIVYGCFLLIRREDWLRLGGFDPAYFMFGEDLDLCLRAADLGARPAITPRATILHEEGASQPYAPREVQILAARIRYLRQHLPRFQRTPAVWAIRLGVLPRLACYFLAAPFPALRSRLARMPHVWAKRDQWWNGYPDLTDPAPT